MAFDMDDTQLIQECKKQNRHAQKTLYERFAPKMLGLCMRYCNNADTAYDLMHDGFVVVFTRIKSYSGKGSFEGWLRKIFVNIVLENFRKEKKNVIYMDEIGNPENFADDEPDSANDFHDIQEIPQEELLEMIRQLPDGYRAVFNLYVFEDMTHKEISEALGIAENTSRSQYSRAKLFLQKQIGAYLSRIKKVRDE